MKYCIFDIETGSQSLETLQAQMPEFEAPSTYKDPEKIKAAIEAKRQAWIDGAALSAETGVVLAIGYKRSDGVFQHLIANEGEMLAYFWELLRADDGSVWVGHNITNFDLPFLIRRSWFYGIHVPSKAFEIANRRNSVFYDTMLAWDMFRNRDMISLDRLAKFLGVGQKTGSGADFAKLLESDKAQAIEYLKNDVELTERVFLRLNSENAVEDCPL